ncbi:MAG: DUF4175 family protein [Bacteroidota bacterium]
MSDTALRLLDTLRERLRAALRRQTAAEVAFGALVLVGVLALLLLVGAGAEAVWWMGSGLRGLWLALFVAATLGLVGYFVAWPLLRLYGVLPGRDERTAAAAAGQRFPEVGDRLSALLDLADGRRGEAPTPLVDHAVTALGTEVAPVPFERIEDTRPARRAAPFAAVPVLGVLAFLLLAPTAFTGATYRLFNPTDAFDRPAPFRLDVQPGDVELVRGDSLTITAQPVGTGFPATATLVLTRPGETRAEPVRVTLGPDGAFSHTLRNLRSTVAYRVETAGVTSPEYTATVVARPLVRGLRVTLRPPAYTGLPAQRLAPGVGDVAALPGTRVEVAVRLGDEPVADAALVLEDVEGTPTDSAALARDGVEAAGAFGLRRPGSYRVHLENADGFANADPVRYRLDLLRDEPPEIILQGPGDVNLADRLQVPVQVRVTDDFGFRSLRLFWRLTESRYGQPTETFEAVDLPIDARTLDQRVLYDWLLAPTTGLDLTPGDAIAYYLEVRDNDTVNGPKTARTGTFTLRLPSLAERFEDLDRAQEEAEDTMEEMREEADDARRRFEELRDQLRRDQQPDFEDRRQLERLQNQQQSLDEQAEKLSEQMQELLDQMQQENLVDEETQQMYEEMQRVIDEIQSPELQEALQRLQESMENLDLPQMMQAMEDFEFNEEQFRERLERALELFKKLEVAQELDEAARRAEELAKTQEALQEQTEALDDESEDGASEDGESEDGESENGDSESGEESDSESENGEQSEGGEESESGEQSESADNADSQQPTADSPQPKTPEQLAEEQERAAEEMQALEELLQEVQEKMEELRDNGPAQEMQQMREQLQQQQIPQQMQQNSQQLQQQQLQDAQQGQQQMQQQLQNLRQQLQEMSQQMQGEQQQINIAALRRSLDDVLTLSEEQETLGLDAQALNRDSPAIRPMAQQQVGLADGLATVADSLNALAREVPQMTRQVQEHTGNALREMGLATEELAERRAPRAAGHQLTSMTHLNDLALLLSELLDQLMNSPSSGGGGGMSMQQMMQQLQQGQQQMGDQIQQMLNDMAGQRLSGDQQQRLEQMARQQQQLREQLQQLMEQGMEDGTLDAQLQSQLQRIAEAMEEAARELRSGRINRRTEQRQQQILERLLQAEESINQRGKKQEREGRSGEEYTNPDPPPLPPRDAEADRLRRDLIRALESGYAPDYQDLIKRYFERLQERAQPSEGDGS